MIIPNMGKSYEKRVSLKERLMMQNEVRMSAAGSFYLQTRYAGLEDFKFKKGEVEIKGKGLVEMCKDKNRSVSLYQAQLLILMTDKLEIYYVNLDTILFSYISSPKSDLPLHLRPFEPLYHHRHPPLTSQHFLPLTSPDDFAFVASFRSRYLSAAFQEVFLQDTLTHSQLKDRKKRTLGLASELETACSLIGTITNHEQQRPIGVLATVAGDGVLRMWSVGGEQCELIMKCQVALEKPDDQIKFVHMFLKARCVIVGSKVGEVFLISSEKGFAEKVQISGKYPGVASAVSVF